MSPLDRWFPIIPPTMSDWLMLGLVVATWWVVLTLFIKAYREYRSYRDAVKKR
jgi:hypothetical protein